MTSISSAKGIGDDIIGAWIEQNAAYVWADTEFYLSPHVEPGPGETPGQPLGHHLKLFVNERAWFAATGTGTLTGNRLIKAAAEFATSFDEFISGLPNLLKDQAGWLAGSPPWTCIAAGWSRRIGRILGVLFEAPHFRPQYSAQGFARPYRREFEALYPGDAADVLSLAQAQMRLIQKSHPLAGAGSLIVAKVKRDEISLNAFDLSTGQRLSTLPDNLEEVGAPVLMNSHLLPERLA